MNFKYAERSKINESYMGKSKGKGKRQKIDDLNEDCEEIGLKDDGGEVNLTVIEIPDISGRVLKLYSKKDGMTNG